MGLIGVGVYFPFTELPCRIINTIFDQLKAVNATEFNISNVFVRCGKLEGLIIYQIDINIIYSMEWNTVSITLDYLTKEEEAMINSLIKLRAMTVLQEI